MPLTPEQERVYQRLGTELGFLGGAGAAPEEDSYGTLGFTGRTLANIFPGALEKIVQPVQSLLGEDKLSSIPDFYDVRAPRNTAEHVIGGAGQLAEYLPAMIGTEGLAASGLVRAGMGANAARIAASGLGFGLPMAPEGAETVGIQGGVGALQSGAQHMGWKGKIAAGLIGAGAGYYEGAKGPDGTPTQGAVMAGLNLLGPTVIDPIVNKLTGYKPGAQPDVTPVPGQPARPDPSVVPFGPQERPLGPDERPSIYRTGQAGLPFGVDDAIAAAQQQSGRTGTTYDVFRGLRDLTNESGMRLNRNWAPPEPNGLPFYEVPDTSGLQLAGSEFLTPRERAILEARKQPALGPQDHPGIFHTGRVGLDFAGLQNEAGIYGRGNEFDIFGQAGVRPAPIMTQGETFARGGVGGLFPEAPLTPREQVILSQSRRGQQGTRAAENVAKDARKIGLPFGLDEEAAIGMQMHSTAPYDAFAGVQRPPIMTQGETFPSGGLFPQAPLSPGEQIAIAARRSGREPSEPHPFLSGKRDTPPAPAVQPKPETPQVILTETAPKPKKVKVTEIRPALDIEGKRYFGKYGDTHQDILNKWKEGKSDEDYAKALVQFLDDETHYFIDKGGNRITREQLEAWHGIKTSQKLREAQGWKPPKTEPVEPAPATAGRAEQVAELERLKEVAELARQKDQNMWGAKTDYPYKQRRRVRDEAYAASDAVDKAWEALYGSRLTGKNEAGQTFSEWLLGITDEYKATIAKIEAEEAARAARPTADQVMQAEQSLNYMQDKLWKMKHGQMGRVTQKAIQAHELEVARLQSIYDDLRAKRYNKPAENKAPTAASVEPTPAPVHTEIPPVDARPRVRVFGKNGWEEAVVIGKEGDTLHVQIEDPIFGPRTTSVLESETRPLAGLQKPIENGGVPFKDVESVKLTMEERARELEGEKHFSLDEEEPTPGTRQHRLNISNKQADDDIIAAIVRGDKPAGNFQTESGKRAAKKAGLVVDEVTGMAARTEAEMLQAKAKRRELTAARDAGRISEDEFHTQMGKLFGYTDNEISDFIAHMKGDEALSSVVEGSGPAHTKTTLKGREKTILDIQEALDLLPPEPRTLIGEILHQVNVAVKRIMPIHFERDMRGAKGASYVQSGRIGINLNWLNGVVQNWDKMSPASQTDALMKATALFGHEVTHTVHRYAENSGMAINGVPISEVIVNSVKGMSESSRRYVAEQILKAKGEKNASERVISYLSGDTAMIKRWYEQQRGPLSDASVERLAAGEVMAEIGSIELVKRMKVDGLPQNFREAVDRFKQVLINTVKWFVGKGKDSDIAALQNLESIASKMYDHFAAAEEHGLSKAFPASTHWKARPTVNPFSSGTSAPPGAPGSPVTVPPDVEVLNGALMKNEMLRLGVRAGVGAAIGGFAGPALAPNQVSTAEGILIGGIAGVFGVTVAKKLLSGDLAVEAAAAFKAHPHSPLKAMAHILGGGKTLAELGIEGRHGWNGIGSSMAKWTRWFEKNFDLNLDPKQKAISEAARGAGAEQIAIVNDALDKVRWFKPNASMVDAVGHYFEGRISKDDFLKLLSSPEQQQYGQFIVTAREAMTNLSNMFADGLPKGAFKTHVMETAETYLGKFYTAYTDGKFNMAHFDKAKQDLMSKLGYTDQTADELMHEYMREVHANRKMFSTGRRGESGEKYDSATLQRRLATEEEIQGQAMVVAGLEHNKSGADYIREKAKLDWMETHKITDNWRAWLGEIEDPMQRMIFTIQKVHASAISGKTFDLLDTMTHTNGNKFSYTPKELVHQRSLLESEIAKAKPDEIAGLQNRLRELNGYGPIPQGAAYGKLSGKWVDRFTRDSLNTYDSPYQWMEQPIIRSLAEFNNLIKIGHTAYNPLTIMRNYLQAPLMGLIAKTTAGDVGEAFREIHVTKGEDYRIMLRKHIIGGDYTSSELSKGPGTIFSGYLDSDIAVKAGKEIHRAVLKGYQQPDMLTRAGAFVSARKRYAQEALEKGIKETVIDPVTGQPVETTTTFADLQDAMKHEAVIDRAVAFTNRYTMNYSTVPAIVKAGRQLPFINLYISYTSEITRILKNLSMDIIAPGPNSVSKMHAITTLGAMAAIPTIMTMGGRGMLSDRDRKDWDQVEALSPNYNRSRFRIPYKREADGRFRYFDITNLLPADNYSQMMKALVQGDHEAFLSANPLISFQNTPLLNMATEQITGEDMRTGQSIQGYGRVREILKEVLPPFIPPGYEGQRLQRAFSSNVEGELGLTNMRTGVQYRPSDIVANYMTGMRFGNVMLSTMQKGAISQAKQQIAEQQQLLRDTTNMNVGPEQRAHAQEMYNKAVEQIMLQLHSKMPVPQSEQ